MRTLASVCLAAGLGGAVGGLTFGTIIEPPDVLSVVTILAMLPISLLFLDPLSIGLRTILAEENPEQHQHKLTGENLLKRRVLAPVMISVMVVVLHEASAAQLHVSSAELGQLNELSYADVVDLLLIRAVCSAFATISFVTLAWIIAKRRNSLASIWGFLTGTVLSALCLYALLSVDLFDLDLLPSSWLLPRSLDDFVTRGLAEYLIGTSLMMGVIGLSGGLIIDRWTGNWCAAAVCLAIALPALLTIATLHHFFGMLFMLDPLWWGYLSIVGGWMIGLFLCPPYFREIIPQRHPTIAERGVEPYAPALGHSQQSLSERFDLRVEATERCSQRDLMGTQKSSAPPTRSVR